MSFTSIVVVAVLIGMLLGVLMRRSTRLSKVKNSQYIPKVTAADVHRIVERDYSSELRDTVFSLLNEYGAQDWHREKDRVRLAVLKLAQGQVDVLRRALDVAKGDFRDVLAPAEYPAYSVRGFRTFELPDQQREQIIASDKKQYEQWLSREA